MDINTKTFLNNCNSENTKETYERIINSFFRFVNKDINDVEYSDIVSYKNDLSTRYSSNTVNLSLRCLKSYFKYLYEELDVIKQNPTVNKKGKPIRELKSKIKNEKEYVPMEIAIKLIEETKSLRMKAIIATYLTTGIRVQELINLTLDDYYNNQVDIITKGKVQRTIQFNDTACKYIDMYLKTRKDSEYDNLFISNQNTPMNRCSLNRTLKLVAKKAGLNCDISNHTLRHTCVSAVCKNTDIETAKEFIGHSDINVTKRYIHSTKEEVIAISNLLNF